MDLNTNKDSVKTAGSFFSAFFCSTNFARFIWYIREERSCFS
nr:MAG TPA: hypothetical protein [Caudoviricetes sp.]